MVAPGGHTTVEAAAHAVEASLPYLVGGATGAALLGVTGLIGGADTQPGSDRGTEGSWAKV